MKLLIDECLHTSLVAVAEARGHEAHHVHWLGLSGATDRDLMPRIIDGDYTFVTNDAVDFRRLYGRQQLHAGLVIIVPQVVPARPRALLEGPFAVVEGEPDLINQVVDIALDGEEVVFTRYDRSA